MFKMKRTVRNREVLFSRALRANFAARRNRQATQANVTIVSRRMSVRLSELSIIERCHIIKVTIVSCRAPF